MNDLKTSKTKTDIQTFQTHIFKLRQLKNLQNFKSSTGKRFTN